MFAGPKRRHPPHEVSNQDLHFFFSDVYHDKKKLRAYLNVLGTSSVTYRLYTGVVARNIAGHHDHVDPLLRVYRTVAGVIEAPGMP